MLAMKLERLRRVIRSGRSTALLQPSLLDNGTSALLAQRKRSHGPQGQRTIRHTVYGSNFRVCRVRDHNGAAKQYHSACSAQ